jgi:hypothetical protein
MGGKSSKPGGIITWIAADHNQAGRAVEKLSSPEMSTVMDGLDPPIYPHSKVSTKMGKPRGQASVPVKIHQDRIGLITLPTPNPRRDAVRVRPA